MQKNLHEIFKAYDIRGIVATHLTDEFVKILGIVLGNQAKKLKVKGLVVGYDGRLSSPKLSALLIEGILQSGCDVYDVGMVATPMVYFANYELQTYSGIMITGSHNPPEYNGFKMVMNGDTLANEKIQHLKTCVENYDINISNNTITTNSANGQHIIIDITEKYLNKITSDINLKRQVHFVVDAGNGVAGNIAPKLYRRLGAKVLGLFCTVDGNFPNHHPDPSKIENLQDLIAAVKSSNTEFGLAFDGDGDRLGVVTKEGNIIYPDRQLMLFIADILEKNPNGTILYDVKSTRLLENWIKDHGGKPVMCKTGHSIIKAKIKETKAVLAGEMSGHIFFNDDDRWYGFDDGVYAGARLIEILSFVSDPSALLNALPNSISTPEINIAIKDHKQHEIVEKLQKHAKFATSKKIITIDGLRVEYETGFGLVRASNTTSVLVLRFEAKTQKELLIIQKEFQYNLKKIAKIKFEI